jgi:cell division septum initiation protein DivIVA
MTLMHAAWRDEGSGAPCRTALAGDVHRTGGHVANFERRSLALDRGAKRRATGSRFGDLSDRLARAFAGNAERAPKPEWEEPDADADEYELRDEREVPWDQVMPRFPIIRHGYDTAAVDAHIADLEQEISELDRELTELRASPPPPDNQVAEEIQKIGEQTSAILLAAHDKAQETTRQAKEQADRCLADAAANAIEMTKEANRKLHELETEKLAVWRERARLLEDVNNLSKALSRLGAEATKRFPAEPKVTPLTAAASETTEHEPVKA